MVRGLRRKLVRKSKTRRPGSPLPEVSSCLQLFESASFLTPARPRLFRLGATFKEEYELN